MQITTVIVDDSSVDRYIVRRTLARRDGFGEFIELETGTSFIEHMQNVGVRPPADPKSVLILMDINMPGLSGFETAEALQELIDAGDASKDITVIMHSSSDNSADRTRAGAIPVVKGYILKPINDDDVGQLVQMYSS
ncbi:MAG: PleD family two-component system response regulator [Congregibacter sp.]